MANAIGAGVLTHSGSPFWTAATAMLSGAKTSSRQGEERLGNRRREGERSQRVTATGRPRCGIKQPDPAVADQQSGGDRLKLRPGMV